MSDLITTLTSVGHTTYVAEARELVHDQVDALFALLMTTIEHTAGASDVHLVVARGDRTLRLTIDPCPEVFAVQATIDLPEGENRAQMFPTGPARCIVWAPDGVIARWDLRPVHSDTGSLEYAWMEAGTETIVTEHEVAMVVDHLLACHLAAHPV